MYDEDMNAMLLLLAAIAEQEGGEIRVSDRARVAARMKAIEVFVELDGTLVVRLVDPGDFEQMELSDE